MVSKDAITERLAKLHAQREDAASQAYRYEGAILALEELLTLFTAGGAEIVDTPEGPAIDLSRIVETDEGPALDLSALVND